MKIEKMKLFESARKSFVSVDLDPNKRPFHRGQLLHIVQGFSATILQLLYLVYDASTAKEYMNSLLMTMVGVLVHFAFWSTIFKTTIIYDFIEKFEAIINESELAFIHYQNVSDALDITKKIFFAFYRIKISKIEINLRKDK